jgi:hypothetical protein
MRTDNADSVSIMQTSPKGFFWAEPWSIWERKPGRRYAQPIVVFWPLALGRWLAKLWRH